MGLMQKNLAIWLRQECPSEALQAATIVNRALLGQSDQLGQIKAGFYADIVASNKNALEDITTLENITFVMKNGKIYKQ